MDFFDWFDENDYFFLEYQDIKTRSTNDIEFTSNIPDEFNEKLERGACEQELSVYRDFWASECGHGIYDFPHEDEEFGVLHPPQWHQQNPQPQKSNFPDNLGYQKALSAWDNQYSAYEKEYEGATEKWQQNQSLLKQKAQQCLKQKYSQAIEKCLVNKREEYEKNSNNREIRYDFDVDGEPYAAIFQKINYQFFNIPIQNGWEIFLEGPNDYNLTHKGKFQNTIYTQLLLATKKFIETTKVDLLSLHPSEKEMIIVYDHFFKAFLSKDFIKIEPSKCIRKELLRDILSKQDNETKAKMYDKVLQSNRAVLNRKKEVIKDKHEQRANRRDALRYVGKLVSFEGKPAIVKSIIHDSKGNPMFHLIYKSTLSSMPVTAQIPYTNKHKIETVQEVRSNPALYQDFIRSLKEFAPIAKRFNQNVSQEINQLLSLNQ